MTKLKDLTNRDIEATVGGLMPRLFDPTELSPMHYHELIVGHYRKKQKMQTMKKPQRKYWWVKENMKAPIALVYIDNWIQKRLPEGSPLRSFDKGEDAHV